MNVTNVRLILVREIRDQLRDRRTLFMIFVLPVLLYPLLGASLSQISQFRRKQLTRVLVLGAENLTVAPALFKDGKLDPQVLHDAGKEAGLLEMHLGDCPDFCSTKMGLSPSPTQASVSSSPSDTRDAARQAVAEGRWDAALLFPADFGRRLQQFRHDLQRSSRRRAAKIGTAATEEKEFPTLPAPEIIYTTANDRSQITCARLGAVMRSWSEAVVKGNLAAAGVAASAAAPLHVQTIDVAEETAYHGAALWAKILPVMLLLWAMTGAFYPAIDLCAGEKERGTLETLLSSPAERGEIVLGKLLTVMLFSMLSAGLNLVSMGFTGWLIVRALPAFGPPPALAIVWLGLALVPVSALFSALCLALAAFARSSKEGQYYLVPLLVVTMPLALLPSTPGVELSLGTSLIPVTGVVLLLRNMLEGNYWQAMQFLPVVLGVTLGACLLSIRWAVDQFNSESVLFREGEQFSLRLWLRHLWRDRQATPTAAAAAFCAVLILMVQFFMGAVAPQPRDFAGFARLTIVTQLVVVLLPALLMALLLSRSPRSTLLLRWPRFWTIPAALGLAIVLHPISAALQVGVRRLYPISEDLKGPLETIDRMFTAAPFWQIALLIAVLPALCEELAFRGFILSGFRQLGHKWRAIVLTAVFFGLTHAIFQQSLVACLVGVVIGLIAVQSGSLLPGILFHLLHNLLLVTSARLPELAQRWPALGNLVAGESENSLGYPWPILLCGAVAGVLLIGCFLWLPAQSKSPRPRAAAARAGEG
ncbi:MAG: ABC transporter permease subunit/CPBP intramembrane protease [Thermoguttaceae bacterium]